MKYLRKKTWIDWVKAIVAIDIAAVGVGLIFQQKIHILADLFGPVSRIIFGVLYIIVAAVIFKAVFPEFFQEIKQRMSPQKTAAVHAPEDQQGELEPKETVGEKIDKAAKKFDSFVQGRAQEVKQEVKKELGGDWEEKIIVAEEE